MRPVQTSVSLPAPAAGSDWTFTPSGSDRVRLQSITAKLTSSATAGNRMPALQVTDETGNLISHDAPSAYQVASQAAVYNWRATWMASGVAANSLRYLLGCPGFWLPATVTIGTSTSGLLAGDQWSGIYLLFLVADAIGAEELEAEILQAIAGS